MLDDTYRLVDTPLNMAIIWLGEIVLHAAYAKCWKKEDKLICGQINIHAAPKVGGQIDETENEWNRINYLGGSSD